MPVGATGIFPILVYRAAVVLAAMTSVYLQLLLATALLHMVFEGGQAPNRVRQMVVEGASASVRSRPEMRRAECAMPHS